MLQSHYILWIKPSHYILWIKRMTRKRKHVACVSWIYRINLFLASDWGSMSGNGLPGIWSQGIENENRSHDETLASCQGCRWSPCHMTFPLTVLSSNSFVKVLWLKKKRKWSRIKRDNFAVLSHLLYILWVFNLNSQWNVFWQSHWMLSTPPILITQLSR